MGPNGRSVSILEATGPRLARPAQGFGRLEYFRGARTVARLSHDLLGCDWLWCLGARVVGFLSKADGPATSGCSRQQRGIYCLWTCARPCARVAAARCAAAGERQPLGRSAALQAFARRGPALKRPQTRLSLLLRTDRQSSAAEIF